ncbi:MAG: FecR domain-containing protein [Proteobacteria bacterium]|nr:FecR domain-containing protein [Pseudomonadota bacterium]
MNVGRFRILFILLIALLLVPCTGYADDDRTVELRVVKNDSLIRICKKYLDDPSRWPEIGRINRLRDFDLIHTGQVLILPVRLLKGVPVDGRVLFVKGDVTLRAAGGKSWMPLRQSDLIRQGSLIRTGRESAVEIVFDDGTSFFQRSDTTLGLDVTQRKGDSHIIQRLILSAGRVLAKVRRATGQDSRIEIQTPSATAVARGTDFRVSVDAMEATTSEVLQGSVDVEALKMVVVVNAGEGTLVTKGAAPLKPRRLLPPPLPVDPKPLYRQAPFRLAFDRVEGAVSYRLQLSTDPEGKDVIREEVIGPGEPLDVAGIDDGVYYLRGRSIDGIGLEGLPLAPQPIRVRINPLPPFIQEPADGAQFKGKAVSFRWMKVRDAVGYQLQISPDREFRDAAVTTADEGAVSHGHAFAAFGSYHFRIRSLAKDGYEGIWSDAIAFTLVPPPPSPVMEKPALADKELRIRWRDQGEKMSYRCQVARDEGFQNLLLERRVDRPEIVLPRPEEPGVYYVRTSTIDPTGYEGGFSLSQSFEIRPVEIRPVEIKKDRTNAPALGASIVGMVALLLLILL